jgi:uncharacterized membrane protein YccC
MNKHHNLKATEAVLPSLIKQAFVINKNPFPWGKSISAGICAGLPVLIGWLLGNLQYGLLTGIGSFTYLYVFSIPYAQRAKKLFFALLGITFSVALGTLLAPYPVASAITVGVIGAVATFIFGSLKITGPAALFFVLVFLLATGMPIDPTLAPLRSGFVLLGGLFSWLVGMIGWLVDPHGPEKDAVKKVYQELGDFLDSVGTESFFERRQRLVPVLKTAEDTVLAGHISWWTTDEYKRLLLLNHQANSIYLEVLEHHEGFNDKLPSEFGETVRLIASSIGNKANVTVHNLKMSGGDTWDGKLGVSIDEAIALLKGTVQNVDLKISKPSLKTTFGGSFDKNSIVFLTSIRYGVVLLIAAIIASSYEFDRSYWIPLSCAAVMSGPTIISTLHRSIQRSFGTVTGILIASGILFLRPEGFMTALLIFLFTFLTELAIVFNYGIAALFITPNAILIAESTTQMHNVAFFAEARVVDVLIGSAIGLLGTLLISKRQASQLLPHLMAKTIRSQKQFLLLLFSEHGNSLHIDESNEHRKMQTNLTNLKIMYTTALGEISRSRSQSENLWPAIFSIEQLGYLLEACLKRERPNLSDESLSQMLLAFEMMARSAEKQRSFPKKKIPEIKGFLKLEKEINNLQDALMISGDTNLK